MKPIIYTAAVVAALLTVLGTRVLVPAVELVYYSALKSWEPAEPEPVLTPVLVSEQSEQRQAVSENQTNGDKAPATKPRTTRKRATRKPSVVATV